MIGFLKNWVFNIAALVVFIVLLEIMIPSGKIKKTINLVSGFILIIAMVNPFLNYFKKGMDLKEFQITDSNFLDRREIEADSKILKEKHMKQITEVYRRKIIRQLEENTGIISGVTGIKADVIINEDYNSDAFGEIKRVYLYITLDKKQNRIKPVVKVEKVRINNDDGIQKENEDKNDKIGNALEIQLEDRISKLFNLRKEDIVINVS